MTNDNSDNLPEGNENFLENDDQLQEAIPERHGCVTAWLIFMLIANSCITLIYLFTINKMERLLKVSFTSVWLLIILCASNVVFSIMLLSWKKSGFYGFIITSIAAFIINLSLGISVTRSVIGLIGFAILYGILQIKKDGVAAWQYLK